MTPERWREIRALFEEVVDLAPAQRARRLQDVATVDPELREAAESLLLADASAEDRLKRLNFELIADEDGRRSSDRSSSDPLGVAGRCISHFEVTELLASGGMGVLYRARDTRLDREVALKFPWPHHLRDDAARERFLREGRAVGALDHPNLCSVYTVGESDEGQLFLAMALYAGETLQARIARHGALPLEDAIAIFRQVVRGIGAAHAAGIIHRDLKPGNLMLLPDGTVKILDFGLAKLLEPSLTVSGTRVGTVAYMAPEQVRGGAVDPRTDLWALGVILYEMITGRRPFEGELDIAVAHAIAHRDPAPPSTLRPDVPPALEDLVLDLLSKEASRRTPSAAELGVALDAMKTGAANTIGRRVARRFHRAGLRVRRFPTLSVGAAVLIVVAGALVGLRSLTTGDTPEPITTSAEARLLYDRARDYEQRAESPENVAAASSLYRRALELDPEFAHAHARLALTSAASYFAGYDRSAARLEQTRAAAEAALRLRPDLAEAHLAMGRYWDEGHRDDRRALAAYQRALQGLPNSAELHAAIARLYGAQGRFDDAVSAYRHALQLNPKMFGVAVDLAFTYSKVRRYDDGIALLDRVIELEPENHSAKLAKGYQVMRRDGTTDTLEAMLRRIPPEWDPQGMGVWARTVLARAQRRPEQALAILDASRVEWSSKGPLVRHRAMVRGQVYEELGDPARARTDYEAAREVFEDSVAANPADPRWRIALGMTYAGLKRRSEAAREARLAMELLPASRDAFGGGLTMVGAAEILARAGDADGALHLLDRLLGMPAGVEASVPLLRLDPAWDRLRDDPRFERMLRRHAPEAPAK